MGKREVEEFNRESELVDGKTYKRKETSSKMIIEVKVEGEVYNADTEATIKKKM
jgi:hypothetical protein